MEMPNLIFIDENGSVFKFDERIHDSPTHQSTSIVEALRRENEELKLKLKCAGVDFSYWKEKAESFENEKEELLKDVEYWKTIAKDAVEKQGQMESNLEENEKLITESADVLNGAYDKIRYGFDILKAKLDRRKWQPIETAPKDGTQILVYCPPEYDGDCDNCSVAAHHELRQNWYRIGYDEAYPIKPSHWMPLPDAPEQPQRRLNDDTDK